MKPLALCLIALSSLIISACASMTPEQCQHANWEQIGLVDGSNGWTTSRLQSHQKSCSKIGIVPDVERYRQGYERGLQQYCQPQTIFDLAMQGRGSVNACPVEQQLELRKFYQVPATYRDAVDELERVRRHYDNVELNLLSSNLSKEQYRYYQSQLNRLRFDIWDARREVDNRELDIRRLKQQYQLH